MILEQYLNESVTSSNNDIPDVEMANEGFRFEDGGILRACALSEAACIEVEKVLMAKECVACKMISESAVNEAFALQENVITDAASSIKKVIMKLWARMKEIANAAKLHFEKLFSNSAFIKDAEKALEKLTDFKDLEFEGYNINYEALDPKAIYNKGAGLATTLANKALAKVGQSGVGSSVEDTSKNLESAKDEMDKLKTDEFSKEFTQEAFSCEPEKVNEEIFKALRGGKDSKEKLTWNKAKCVSAVKNLSTLKNKVDGVANDIDILHKAAIKEVDKAIEEKNKADNNATDVKKPKTSALATIVKDKAQCIQTVLNYSNRVINAQMEALKEDCSQSKSFIMAAISQARKNSHNVNASTDLLGESSAFNFIDNY
jgi:hypothetical protein